MYAVPDGTITRGKTGEKKQIIR